MNLSAAFNSLHEIVFMGSARQVFNSYPPTAAYMRPWSGSALVQVMACRLLGAKALPEPMLAYCQLNKFQWNSNRNSIIFIQENAFESVVGQNGDYFVRRK